MKWVKCWFSRGFVSQASYLRGRKSTARAPKVRGFHLQKCNSAEVRVLGAEQEIRLGSQ